MAAVQTSTEKGLNRLAIVGVLIATTTGGSMRVDRMKNSRSCSPFTLNREKP